MKEYSFKLLDASINAKMRIQHVLDSIRTWVLSDELRELLEAFDYTENLGTNISTSDFSNHLRRITAFADANWNLRNGRERWAVDSNQKIKECSAQITAVAEALQMHLEAIYADSNIKGADYMIPLGGARLANFTRAERAKDLLQIAPNAAFCALSAQRPLAELEKPFIEKYAKASIPAVHTEYDAMNEAIEVLFKTEGYQEQNCKGIGESDIEKQNSAWSFRKYNAAEQLFSLSAPSSQPKARRANTLDTIAHFANVFHIAPSTKLALITTSLYVPFQTLMLAPFAIENRWNISIFGAIHSSLDGEEAKPLSQMNALYLQEIKATIDACSLFYQKYET